MFNKHRLSFVLLGIGIGIILTNTIYIFNPNIEYRDYSEEEIINLASDLGMVFIKDNIQPSHKNEESKNIETSINEPKKYEKIKFAIEKGDSLEKVSKGLFELGIIDNMDEFNKLAKEKNIQKKLRVGTYELSPSFDYETIIKVITKSLY
jgi:hypothetical protein